MRRSPRGSVAHFSRPPTTSGLPPETDILEAGRHVPNVPQPDSAVRQKGLLFDHLVGAGEQRRWHREPERLSGREIYDQLELGRLLDREVGGLRATQNLV